MASLVSTGSPRSSRKSTPSVPVLDEGSDSERTQSVASFSCYCNATDLITAQVPSHAATLTSRSRSLIPLKSDTLRNLQPSKLEEKVITWFIFIYSLFRLSNNSSSQDTSDTATSTKTDDMDDILTRLRLNDSRKPSLTLRTTHQDDENLDKLLTNLNDQNRALKQQEKDLKNDSDSDKVKQGDFSSDSDLYTPATESFGVESGHSSDASDTLKIDMAEVFRVKQELEAARSVISRQEQELAETRTFKHTMEQAMGPPSEVDFGNNHHDVSEQTIGHLQSAFNASARPFTSRTDGWLHQDDARSDFTVGSGNFPRTRGIWNETQGSFNVQFASGNNAASFPPASREPRLANQVYSNVYGTQPFNDQGFAGPRSLPRPPPAQTLGFDGRIRNDAASFNPQVGGRRNIPELRSPSALSDPMSHYNFSPSTPSFPPNSVTAMGMPGQFGYQQRPLGSPVSPILPDFPNRGMQGQNNDWTLPVSSSIQVQNSTNCYRLLLSTVKLTLHLLSQ